MDPRSCLAEDRGRRQTITFDEGIAPERSYLNDVRVDTKTDHAFITDSGTGSIRRRQLEDGESAPAAGRSSLDEGRARRADRRRWHEDYRSQDRQCAGLSRGRERCHRGSGAEALMQNLLLT